VPYPICGKCGSKFVYSDRDERGARIICCLMCGNRMPGAGKGFYMSDKVIFNESQAIKTEAQREKTQDTLSVPRICAICKTKKTISPKHNICGSCMAAKANQKKEKRRKLHSEGTKSGKMTISGKGCALNNQNMSIVINFSKHPAILNQLKKLADDEIRPLEAQIVFLLKSHFSQLDARR